MSDNEYAVLTVKGWDGSRILGLFKTVLQATKFRDDFIQESGGLRSDFKDEFYIDVLRMGKISNACEIRMRAEDTATNTTTRKHIYS